MNRLASEPSKPLIEQIVSRFPDPREVIIEQNAQLLDNPRGGQKLGLPGGQAQAAKPRGPPRTGTCAAPERNRMGGVQQTTGARLSGARLF